MKKFFVLGVLFALPIIAYLFFASGKNNFARLPVMTEGVKDISSFETLDGEEVSIKNKISILAFLGNDLQNIKGNTFNLDQKILEKYYEFKDFQFVILLPDGTQDEAKKFVEEFQHISNTEKWNFVFAPLADIEQVFNSLQSPLALKNGYNPYVFIIDKDGNLRGRDDDEDRGILYGYDSRSVSELGNKMNDDVRVILAEYRLALKKNNRRNEINLE